MPRADEVREIRRNLEQRDIALDLMAEDGVTQAQVLARCWMLQRRDEGAWRITETQSL